MRYFETTIRVPMPDGSLAWGKIAAAIEPAFDALAKGLAKAGVEGVEIAQREVRVKGPRAPKAAPDPTLAIVEEVA
jgi:hypothetical protein